MDQALQTFLLNSKQVFLMLKTLKTQEIYKNKIPLQQILSFDPIFLQFIV